MDTTVEPGAVVVGVDSAPAARLALAWGADEAARRCLPLHLVHALGEPYGLHRTRELDRLWAA